MPQKVQENPKKPNILLIMGDDIGWSNVSAYNHGMMGYHTPNIDRLAKEGAMFYRLVWSTELYRSYRLGKRLHRERPRPQIDRAYEPSASFWSQCGAVFDPPFPRVAPSLPLSSRGPQ